MLCSAGRGFRSLVKWSKVFQTDFFFSFSFSELVVPCLIVEKVIEIQLRLWECLCLRLSWFFVSLWGMLKKKWKLNFQLKIYFSMFHSPPKWNQDLNLWEILVICWEILLILNDVLTFKVSTALYDRWILFLGFFFSFLSLFFFFFFLHLGLYKRSTLFRWNVVTQLLVTNLVK